MAGQYNSICITGVAASVLEALGVAPRADMQPPIGALTQLRQCLLGGTVDRALLYNPDAIAFWLYQKYTDLFTDAMCRSAVSLPMLSVMPSVTPVCFASMYAGVTSDVHGIQAYEKPVLTVPTLFDALIAAGKKPAIVSTAGDSISVIFLNRSMDYFIYDTVDEVNAKAHELIEADRHDVIVVYNADYDAQMHRTGPESPEAMDRLRANIAVYSGLVDAVRNKWPHHNTLYGFMPDHGCHLIDGGCGSHGLDMDTDMNVIHFYGFSPRK